MFKNITQYFLVDREDLYRVPGMDPRHGWVKTEMGGEGADLEISKGG